MTTDALRIIFAPVTRFQAEFFAGIAAALQRRGSQPRFACPDPNVAEPLLDIWGDRVDVQAPHHSRFLADTPTHIGAYDQWRYGWDEPHRARTASYAMSFWQSVCERRRPHTIVVWNGRDHTFLEAAVVAAQGAGVEPLYFELGPLRDTPYTIALHREGVNAAARFRRHDLLTTPLQPHESMRLEALRTRFRAAHEPLLRTNPYLFLPLQVDDDTQFFYYAPHFANQRDMVRAVVEAMPVDVSLVLKLHPLSDARLRQGYQTLLRPHDKLAPISADTLALIAGADAVITNNSSAGVEALVLERPVVVLGQAHYAGRGFTHDYQPPEAADDARRINTLSDCIAQARVTPPQSPLRDRYLHELLFHETVWITANPNRRVPTPAEFDRLAVRLHDLLAPTRLGSDWTGMFTEAQAIQQQLEDAVRNAMNAAHGAGLLVLSRAAQNALHTPDLPSTSLDDCLKAKTQTDGPCYLLAPELTPAQRDAVLDRIRTQTRHPVADLLPRLSAQPCRFMCDRFNTLPRPLRDQLYETADYWDYYLTHSGLAPENTPIKNAQISFMTPWITAGDTDQPPKTILEYGCGDGRIIEGLLDAAPAPQPQIVGVDSSERMLMLARERLKPQQNFDLLPGNAADLLPFSNAAFDLSYTCGTLAHIPTAQLPTVVHELARVTRDTLIHWEVFEAHQPAEHEHYTNPDASLTIHQTLFRRLGPVEFDVADARRISGQNALATRYHLRRPCLTVLTLHAVDTPDPSCPAFDYRNMFLPPWQLEEVLDGLLAADFTFRTIDDALDDVRNCRLAPKCIALTFDDGYLSVYQHARPILEQRGIRATVYVTTGPLGDALAGQTSDPSAPALPLMHEQHLRQLHDAGWSIGAHTVNHPNLARCTENQVRQELTQSRQRLQKILHAPVRTFAFPYGEPETAYRPHHVDLARDVGFDLALSMRPGFVHNGEIRADWPRIGVGNDALSANLLQHLAETHRRQAGWPTVSQESPPTLDRRVRDVVRRCVSDGVDRIALYGAGQHTARLLQSVPLYPLQVLGIIDDNAQLRGGSRYGLPVYAPTDIKKLRPDAVLISSDAHEEAIYQRIAPLESQGVRVLRLYDA